MISSVLQKISMFALVLSITACSMFSSSNALFGKSGSSSAITGTVTPVVQNGYPGGPFLPTLYASPTPMAIPTAPGTTWYVRADGGTRYSANNPTGQCNGKFDSAYAGAGVNQNCAFGDVRWLWDDQHTNNTLQWVIAGGDTVIIDNSKQWRIGWDTDGTGTEPWCPGLSAGPYGCLNPTIPAGTAGQHTRILGRNYQNCSVGNNFNPNAMTQLYGGHGIYETLNLAGTQYVDVECLEITRHSQCALGYGLKNPYPSNCNKYYPGMDDYDNDGVETDNTTANVLLQDVWDHGHTGSGIHGPIGGAITMSRVNISFNGFAGWNFDNGSDTADAPGSTINASYVTQIGNGCFQEYPMAHQFPGVSCYDLNSGGFGDSWSGQDTALSAFTCDHCTQMYNTKDGFIGPHTGVVNLTITNSQSIGNMGQQWKWDVGTGSTTILDNLLTVGNCNRMSANIPGAPGNYTGILDSNGNYSGPNANYGGGNLTLFCRASGDMYSIGTAANSSVYIANNTVVGYSNTVFDLFCDSNQGGGTQPCTGSPFTFVNNLILGFNNPNFPGYPGEGPSAIYLEDSTITMTRNNNLYYGMRYCPTGMTSSENCTSDPLFIGEPSQTWVDEAQLDSFNFSLSPTSPALHAGVAVPGLMTNFLGNTITGMPNIGAY